MAAETRTPPAARARALSRTGPDRLLETLTEAERAALADWLAGQGVEPRRRGRPPRGWVPVEVPEDGWVLKAPLAPGRTPVFVPPPGHPDAPAPGAGPTEWYPLTETQAARAARLRRERAARAARGEPEPEPGHERRLRHHQAAQGAARALGDAVRAWRRAQGVTQQALARRLGVPQPNVVRLERGEVTSPGFGALLRLAEATGLAVQLRFTGEGITVALTGEGPAADQGTGERPPAAPAAARGAAAAVHQAAAAGG
jgi:transcriptional regulator with XRE-family HTH domain